MRVNPFDGLKYMVGEFDLPPGWKMSEDRQARKCVKRAVGKQGNRLEHLNTNHRKNKATLYDEDGNIIQTANLALYRYDSDLSDAAIIEAAYEEIAEEVGRNLTAVKQHVTFTVIGNQQAALDLIAANPEDWGEVSA